MPYRRGQASSGPFGGISVQLLDNVRVQVAGDAYTTVSQPLAHGEQGHSGGEASGSSPMTKPVERDDWQPATPRSPLKGPQDEVGMEAVAVLVGQERAPQAPSATFVAAQTVACARNDDGPPRCPPNCKPLASFGLMFAVPTGAGPSASETKNPLVDGPFRH